MQREGSLKRKSSQETLISLLQLDPSPIDSPDLDLDKELPAVPVGDDDDDDQDKDKDKDRHSGETARGDTAIHKAASAGAPGLSGTGRGAIFYLSRIQKYSSYAFSVFTSLHLANVSLIPAVTRSVPGSETYLLMTREIYQTTFTEPLLVVLPVLAHVGAGVALRLLRRSQNMRRYGGATPGMFALHRSRAAGEVKSDGHHGSVSRSPPSPWPPVSYISISGYVFSVVYSAHVFMNRVMPRAVDGDSSNIGLAYVAHGFARHPLVSYAAYVGLIAVGSGHMAWGAARWLGLAPSTAGWWQGGNRGTSSSASSVLVDKRTRRQRRRKWLGVHGVAAAVAALWAVGGVGVVARGGLADGWIGKLYDDLFGRLGL